MWEIKAELPLHRNLGPLRPLHVACGLVLPRPDWPKGGSLWKNFQSLEALEGFGGKVGSAVTPSDPRSLLSNHLRLTRGTRHDKAAFRWPQLGFPKLQEALPLS